MKKNLMKSAAMGALLLSMAACNGKTSTGEATCCAAAGEGQCTEQCGNDCKNECNNNANCKINKEMKYSKKYTNADFYKDGKVPTGCCYGSNERHVRFLRCSFHRTDG